jgi:hypothetical protein
MVEEILFVEINSVEFKVKQIRQALKPMGKLLRCKTYAGSGGIAPRIIHHGTIGK